MYTNLTRRHFLESTSLAGAALAAAPVLGANINAGTKKLKAGLIGCGGRGNGAIKNWLEACKLLGIEGQLVATADAFRDKAVSTGKQHGVPEDKCFGGFDAYHKVIESDCYFVLMATPPAFRPLHLAAVIDAGKHAFIEKPVAVDPVGARSVIATGEKAKAKGLAIVTASWLVHSYLRIRGAAVRIAEGQIALPPAPSAG